MRKNAKFRRDKPQQRAITELKCRLANTKTLGYYDKNTLTKVIVDASKVGLRAVLVHLQKESSALLVLQLINYFLSTMLIKTEDGVTNIFVYSTH